MMLTEFYDEDAITQPVIPVSYKLSVKEMAWISKIKGLNAHDCINIYMAPNLPLVITTNIANYGLAIFTMVSIDTPRKPLGF